MGCSVNLLRLDENLQCFHCLRKGVGKVGPMSCMHSPHPTPRLSFKSLDAPPPKTLKEFIPEWWFCPTTGSSQLLTLQNLHREREIYKNERSGLPATFSLGFSGFLHLFRPGVTPDGTKIGHWVSQGAFPALKLGEDRCPLFAHEGDGVDQVPMFP